MGSVSMMGRTAIFKVLTVFGWGAQAESRKTKLSNIVEIFRFIESGFLSYGLIGADYYGITFYQPVKIIHFFALILTDLV
jgi:hypothetical protein